MSALAKAKPARGRAGAKSWRIVRRSLLGLLALVVALGICGASYNALALRHLRKAYPPPGGFFTVNGHRMHLYCTGQGSPTVVLESGRAEGFLVWGKVQPGLSRVTRVCSYDRAGLGWSEGVDGPRDSDHIADQLHALLAQAGVVGPLIMMGHSAGGLHVRAYAARFPQQVAGLVFVDATTPGKNRVPASVIALDQHGALQLFMFKAAITLGIPRIMGACSTPPPGFEATADLWRADACKPGYVTAFRRENEALPASLAEARRSGGFGNLPILVFTRDPQLPPPAQLPATVSAADWHKGTTVHTANEHALARLSTRSRFIIAKGSGHYIQFTRPDLLVRDVGAFVLGIRSGNTTAGNDTTVPEQK